MCAYLCPSRPIGSCPALTSRKSWIVPRNKSQRILQVLLFGYRKHLRTSQEVAAPEALPSLERSPAR